MSIKMRKFETNDNTLRILKNIEGHIPSSLDEREFLPLLIITYLKIIVTDSKMLFLVILYNVLTR